MICYRKAILILTLFLIISLSGFTGYTELSSSKNQRNTYSNQDVANYENTISESQMVELKSPSSPTELITPDGSEITGILHPVVIEQSGYQSIGDFVGRTDTGLNLLQEFTIDDTHGWQASAAEINVWNLNRLYVENGTFSEGYPGATLDPLGNVTYYPLGWDADSIDTLEYPDDAKLAGYDSSSSGYITVESQGGKVGQKAWGHAAGTRVVWSQLVQNNPYTEDFVLSFDYFYLRGPIDGTAGLQDITGNCSLAIFINGINVWNLSLLLLQQRGIWMSSGNVPLTINDPSSTFLFEIGLIIDESMVLNTDYDYDGDPLNLPDGIGNAYYITAFLDNLLLTGIMAPEFNQIDFTMNIDAFSSEIEGSSGIGYANITNSEYWTTDSISLVLSSNTSIMFEFNVRLLCHHFLNSSWTNDINEYGVFYSITSDQSAELDIFTYLGFLGVYDELQLRVYYSLDWQNFTVYDPFLTDVTVNCDQEINCVVIPTILLEALGWWQIHCQSPNYAYDASIERYDTDAFEWVNGTLFHSYDDARLSVTIKSGSFVPILSTPINFTWILANCSVWYESSTTSGQLGSAVSTSVTFGPTNTTAGYWSILFHWTNGSEIAYGCVMFTLHHRAAIENVYPGNLETPVGQPVTIVLRFYDEENGMLLINNGAEINGTWAGGVVQFEPNIVKNWWQADFNTAIVGAGIFDVIITSAASYFETTPLVITIKSEYLTSLAAPNGPLEPLIYGRAYSFDFAYTANYDESGIEDGVVEVTEEGSEWISVTETGNGHYNLTLIPLGLQDYSIRITFSKVGYANQTHYLNFLVKRVPIKVTFLSSLSNPELKPLEIKVEVTETDTDKPVTDANVTLNVLSQIGILYASEIMIEESPGVYVTTIIMPMAGEMTYSAEIYVEKENYELTQSFADTLVPTVDTNARLVQAVMGYSTQILFVIGVLASVIGGQKYYSRRRKLKQAKARVIKARIADANNLLGIIVLHKLSGVPIYSKIFKSGLEEGMLSAFITAIMHFRSEFDIASSTGEYRILPISDIVRAIPTENLICAFITITSASPEQETRMLNFARAVGMMLDDGLAQRPSKVVDAKTVKTLEWLFDDFVDGSLLREYRLGEKPLPRHLKCITDVITEDNKDQSFKLMNLIRLLESCGIDEDDAYILVMDAIENEYLIPLYQNNGLLENNEIDS